MTNRERYQRAFRPVRPSTDIYTEVLTMTTKKRKFSKALVSVCVAVILVIAGATAAYAADLGGFRQMVTMWVKGEQQTVMVEQVDDHFEWTDVEGRFTTGSGWVETGDGEGRPMTLEEWASNMENQPGTDVTEDGRVWFTFGKERFDITDQVAGDGIAHVELEYEGINLYFSIRGNHDGGYTINSGRDGFDDKFSEDGEYPEGEETVHTIETELE